MIQPNYLIIVADDLGYSDVGCYGGEIHTPNIDSLAQGGTRFTDFHTAAACSPTRSMLHSGTDHHLVGLGQLAEFVRGSPAHQGKPGHEGYLSDSVATLPEVLREGGYYTCMSGKWHMGLKPEHAPAAHGYTKSFSMLAGCANHYAYLPKVDKNDKQPPFFQTAEVALHIEDSTYVHNSTLGEDFYSSDYYADRMVGMLQERPNDKPFFAYLPFTAPHWPLQAPPESVAKYKDWYNAGPKALKEQRLEGLIKQGLVEQNVKDLAHPMVDPRANMEWDSLTNEQRSKSARSMEVYAGMVDRMDYNIGKVISELKTQGVYDNTIILFMSDNGAEGASYEALPVMGDEIMNHINQYYNNSLENIGRKDSFVWYGSMWAQAATAPSRLFKMFSTEGGCRVPFIYKSAGVPPKEAICTKFSTVMDIMPTFLDMANVAHPGQQFNGREVLPMRGESWVPYLTGQSEQIHSDDYVMGWELIGQAALRKGDWKINFVMKPFGSETWQLFNLRTDPGETTDLSDAHPQKLKELIAHWDEYAQTTNVVGLKPDLGTIAIKDEMESPKQWMELDTSASIMQQLQTK